MTDNVVRPLDGLYGVITSAPPSVALWIIQDYVVILLILIALRFQSKYCNSKVALGSNEVLSGRHDWAAASVSSLFSLYLVSSVSALSISGETDICFSDAAMIYSRRRKSSPITVEENTYLPARRVKARQRQTGSGAAFASTQSFLPPESGNFSDGIFVSGGASCGYCSTVSPPTDALLLLHTALISPRLTSRHATEPPADSCLRLEAT